ncbi:chemotaxis protein [Clostridium estertheticum]|uniref:methyl-accepting chemotaxis protein n=1 Tax=Clostridium estertheticum TaxID=238834 RepID=UPI001C0E6BF3|nr:methyl-accepting chemotaxis protein [Clostridium estertheticum]MBU3178375.1 chemotaxis protein [Clostridium estertheticum]
MFLNDKSESEFIMDFLVRLAPTLQRLIPLDCIIGIADTKKFLCSIPGEKMKLPVDTTGTEILEDVPIAKAIKSGKPERMIVPKEVLGISFQATSIPVLDSQGKVIGGIGLGIGLGNREILINTANLVASITTQTAFTIDDLATSAGQLETQQYHLLGLANEITKQISETEKIIEIIRGVAHTSNMLGLNASIEAARAGEQGKGFSVVAGEIRKMAKNSSIAIKDVENILNNIKEKIHVINEKINETSSIGHHHATVTGELSKTMEELSESANKLKLASSIVIG